MSRHWTLEQRARQAQVIQHWQPWRKSIGPKTESGKARASQNALKHGLRSAEWRNEQKRIHALLREYREHLEQI